MTNDTPIAVRLITDHKDQILGENFRGLSFRKTAPGGYASGTLRLIGRWDEWRIGPADHVIAYNARTGGVLWEGYTDNPGQSFDVDGESFDIGVQGASTLLSDQAESLLWLDTKFDNWRADDRNDDDLSPSANASASAWPDTEQSALLLQFASGTPIAKHSEARMVHDLADSSPMGIGAWGFKVRAGITSNGYEGHVRLSNGNGTVNEFPMSTGIHYATGLIEVTHPNAGDVLKIVLRRKKGATNIGTDRIWMGFADPYVVGNRRWLDGSQQLDLGSDLSRLLSHEVVADLALRMMSKIDTRRSSVEAPRNPFEIDQLCYANPTTARSVLDDLELFEPDMTWEVGPSRNGLHSFTYRRWPNQPRYEVSTLDGYDAPGGEVDLCNRIAVGWTDRKGREHTEVVTAYVHALGGWPGSPGARTRDAEKITLDEAKSSKRNAQRIGEQALELMNSPPTSATATIARTVWDRDEGRMVAPHEIEPGYLALLRETGEQLRITEVQIDTDDLTAGLTLGEPAPTIEQKVAQLTKVKGRR